MSEPLPHEPVLHAYVWEHGHIEPHLDTGDANWAAHIVARIGAGSDPYRGVAFRLANGQLVIVKPRRAS